jgi:hypothetical protein
MTTANPMRSLLFKASDLNKGIDTVWHVELSDLDSLRLLLMQAEVPLIIGFAKEEDSPAEIEIVVYDDEIEI